MIDFQFFMKIPTSSKLIILNFNLLDVCVLSARVGNHRWTNKLLYR